MNVEVEDIIFLISKVIILKDEKKESKFYQVPDINIFYKSKYAGMIILFTQRVKLRHQ